MLTQAFRLAALVAAMFAYSGFTYAADVSATVSADGLREFSVAGVSLKQPAAEALESVRRHYKHGLVTETPNLTGQSIGARTPCQAREAQNRREIEVELTQLDYVLTLKQFDKARRAEELRRVTRELEQKQSLPPECAAERKRRLNLVGAFDVSNPNGARERVELYTAGDDRIAVVYLEKLTGPRDLLEVFDREIGAGVVIDDFTRVWPAKLSESELFGEFGDKACIGPWNNAPFPTGGVDVDCGQLLRVQKHRAALIDSSAISAYLGGSKAVLQPRPAQPTASATPAPAAKSPQNQPTARDDAAGTSTRETKQTVVAPDARIYRPIVAASSGRDTYPPDDLTGIWRGRMPCTTENGSKAPSYQEAELTFVPSGAGWTGSFTFRSETSGKSTSRVDFDAVVKDSNRSTFTDITLSNWRWISNPENLTFTKLRAQRYIEDSVYYVDWDIVGLETRCYGYFPMRYVDGSGKDVLNSTGTITAVRDLSTSLRQYMSICSKITSVSDLAKCIVRARSAFFRDTSADHFSSRYISSVIHRAKSNLRSNSCSSDLALLMEFLHDLKKYKFDNYLPKDCKEVSDVFEAITGVPENYVICADIRAYSRESVLKCLDRLWAVKGPQKAGPLYRSLTETSEYKRFGGAMTQLFDAATYPRLYLDVVRSDLLRNVRQCNDGVALSEQVSPLSIAFADAMTFGYADDDPDRPDHETTRAAVTCSDMAHFLVNNKLIDGAQVEALLKADGTLDLCGQSRASSAPTLQEVGPSGGQLALQKMCSPQMFQTVVTGALMAMNFVEKGGMCKMDALGLPIASLTHRFRAATCRNDGVGHAVCDGVVEMFCSAADESRELLDCLGKNVSYPAKITYVYDKATCSWEAQELGLDVAKAKLLEPLR